MRVTVWAVITLGFVAITALANGDDSVPAEDSDQAPTHGHRSWLEPIAHLQQPPGERWGATWSAGPAPRPTRLATLWRIRTWGEWPTPVVCGPEWTGLPGLFQSCPELAAGVRGGVTLGEESPPCFWSVAEARLPVDELSRQMPVDDAYRDAYFNLWQSPEENQTDCSDSQRPSLQDLLREGEFAAIKLSSEEPCEDDQAPVVQLLRDFPLPTNDGALTAEFAANTFLPAPALSPFQPSPLPLLTEVNDQTQFAQHCATALKSVRVVVSVSPQGRRAIPRRAPLPKDNEREEWAAIMFSIH